MPSRSSAQTSARKVCAERASLAREAVGAPRHAIPDREVAFLLADDEQRSRELDGTLRVEEGDQRQLGAVDVPHRGDVEDERPGGPPERALVGGEARLDQRVVERGREDRAALARGGLDPNGIEAVGPVGSSCSAAAFEAAPAGTAVGVEVRAGLLDATEREAQPELDPLSGLGRAEQDQAEGAQRGGTDRVELELGAPGHEPLVVPEHLAP